jgi:hypothetical protein
VLGGIPQPGDKAAVGKPTVARQEKPVETGLKTSVSAFVLLFVFELRYEFWC